MKKRSVVLCISVILATIYSIYLMNYFAGATVNSESTAEGVGAAIATALVAPHMCMIFLGAIFGWIGVLSKKTWAALVAAILYSVGAALFLLYIFFAAPILILGFVGYANQKKINARNEELEKIL